jgi:hypothetical protein
MRASCSINESLLFTSEVLAGSASVLLQLLLLLVMPRQ